MPRSLPIGLKEVLKSSYATTHSTLELSLPSDFAPSITYYFATARLTIGGVVYDRQLRNSDAVKTSLTKAADRVTVELQNVDTILGVDFLRVADSLYGANVKFGRYWKDLRSAATFHHTLLTGCVAGVEINENVARLTLISDTYAAVSVGAREQVLRQCRFQVQGEFRGTACGYSGALLTCNGLYDSADGCEGRHGTPLKQAKFGGFVYIEGKNTVAGAAALPIPASNQLIKLVDLTANTETAKLQQPFLALDNDRFHATNNNTDLRTEIVPKGLATGYENAVDDYDALTDGTTDTTTELQNAITAAEAAGGTIYLNPGIYKTTGIAISGNAKIVGSNDGSTVIYSTTNAPIVEFTAGSFKMPVLENVTIRGSVSAGSSQIGLKIDDGTYGLRCRVSDVVIENCGGNGLYVGNAFSSYFEKIYIDNCAGYPFLYNAPAMPNNVFESCYVGLLRDSAPTAYRIKAGDCILRNCNGVNSLNPNSRWAVVGKKNGIDGDSTDTGANLSLENCNLESWIRGGILAYHASVINLRGFTTFAGQSVTTTLNGGISNSVTSITLTSASNFPDAGTILIDSERITYTGKSTNTLTGCTRGAESTSAASHLTGATVTLLKKPVEFDLVNDGVDYYAQQIQRGVIEESVRFGDGPLTNYARNQAIHANGFAPIQTTGRGARVASDTPLSTYWNSTAGANSFLERADSFLPISTITGSTTYAQPGVRLIYVNHSGSATVTLPWPGWYQQGECVTIKDVSTAGAATNNITVNAGGGGTVNGSSFTMNANGQSIVLTPDGSNDWKIVADYTPGGSVSGSGTSGRVAYWSGTSALTSDGDFTFDGFNLTAGRLYHSGGTAGAPGVASSSDSGTGFYLSSAGVYGYASSAANGGAGGNVLLLAGDGMTVDGRLTLTEKTAPSTPSANSLVLYAKDKSGVSTLYYKKDDGTEIEIGSGGGGSGSVNSGTANQLAYYATTGTAVSGLTSANSSVLVTNGSGVPSWSTSLPSGVTLNGSAIVVAGGVTSSGLTMATARLLGRTTASSGAIEEISVSSALSLSAGTLTIASGGVTNAMLATIATATFKGRTTAGTGNVEDLTATQATALLNVMVGDSGAGGTKGLVPAPASGDAAANKFLKADGNWTAVGATVSGANPTATIGLSVVNGSAATFMRSDAAPPLSQAIAPTWTGLHTFNPGTTPQNAIVLDIAALGSAGTRDSHFVFWRGRANNGVSHTPEWRALVGVTTNAGESTWTLQQQLDSGGWTNALTVSDAGEITSASMVTDFFTSNGAVVANEVTSTLGYQIGGAATTGNYLRGNGTYFVSSSLLAADLSGTVAVANGGTGQTSYTNGQLLIGNTTGSTLTKATLTGTTGQIDITNGNGSITLSASVEIQASEALFLLRNCN